MQCGVTYPFVGVGSREPVQTEIIDIVAFKAPRIIDMELYLTMNSGIVPQSPYVWSSNKFP